MVLEKQPKHGFKRPTANAHALLHWQKGAETLSHNHPHEAYCEDCGGAVKGQEALESITIPKGHSAKPFADHEDRGNKKVLTGTERHFCAWKPNLRYLGPTLNLAALFRSRRRSRGVSTAVVCVFRGSYLLSAAIRTASGTMLTVSVRVIRWVAKFWTWPPANNMQVELFRSTGQSPAAARSIG